MGFKRIFMAALMLVAAQPALSQPIPVEDFFKLSSFNSVQLSPDGKYIAATVPLEDKTALVIMDLKTKQITASHKPQNTVHVMGFYWVSAYRVVYTVAFKTGKYANPVASAGIYALNADGTNQGTQYAAGVSPRILDTLKDDDKFVLVQYRGDRGVDTIGKMNVENGDIKAMARSAPWVGYGSFTVDNASEPRFYLTGKNMKDLTTYIRKGDKWEWEIFHQSKVSGHDIEIQGFSSDNSIVYYSMTQDSGPDALYTYSMKTGERKQVVRDDNVNPAGLLSSPVDDAPFAVRFMDGFPRYEWLDKSNPYAKDLMSLQASFPDTEVSRTSSTYDGKKSIYVVYSDTNQGEFYLFDHVTKKAEHLVSSKPWLDSSKLSLMDPVKFKARDGLELEGFLTLPKGSKGKNLPLIIHPHGGPFGPYDGWGFREEIQLLANRGYAVLQVNFRGSGNYGKAFQEKGYKQWGKAMQDDLTDATRWAIAQGIADPNRICIYGASYGGYAALMGAAKEPSLYKCAVGNVGVYDLPDMVAEDAGSGGMMNPLKVFFRETANPEDSTSSPTRVAGQIKVPVYMMAGSKDTTCPPEWTKKMYKALEVAGVPVQMHIYEGEMHGNVQVSNQVDFANRLLAFLDQHIGKK
jgi:dipeptidyl aminopeptidase/acylaminoacyl peptidase